MPLSPEHRAPHRHRQIRLRRPLRLRVIDADAEGDPFYPPDRAGDRSGSTRTGSPYIRFFLRPTGTPPIV